MSPCASCSGRCRSALERAHGVASPRGSTSSHACTFSLGARSILFSRSTTRLSGLARRSSTSGEAASPPMSRASTRTWMITSETSTTLTNSLSTPFARRCCPRGARAWRGEVVRRRRAFLAAKTPAAVRAARRADPPASRRRTCRLRRAARASCSYGGAPSSRALAALPRSFLLHFEVDLLRSSSLYGHCAGMPAGPSAPGLRADELLADAPRGVSSCGVP